MPRWGDPWTESDVIEYERKFKGNNNSAVPIADAQSDLPDALDTTPQTVQVDQQFRVRVISSGRRLADTDGNSVKAVLDSITKVGIWRDDSSRFIKEISFTQENGKEDQTIIEIWQVI